MNGKDLGQVIASTTLVLLLRRQKSLAVEGLYLISADAFKVD